MTFLLDNGINSLPDGDAWIAVQEEAKILAYASGRSRVTIRRTTPPFARIACLYHSVADSMYIQWFRWVSRERAKTGSGANTKSDQRWQCFVLSRNGDYVIIEYRKATLPSLGNIESAHVIQTGHIPFSANALRLLDGPDLLYSGGSVTTADPITPIFEGVLKLAESSWLAVWSYDNENPYAVSSPRQAVGATLNHFIGGSAEQNALLPTLFLPGVQRGVVGIHVQGEALTWEVQTSLGSETAALDYDQELDPDLALKIAPYVVRHFPPALIQFSGTDPLELIAEAPERLTALRFNNAGVAFDGSAIRHTDEPNTDIANVSEYYPRAISYVTAGGHLMLHPEQARISRTLETDRLPELARGVVT